MAAAASTPAPAPALPVYTMEEVAKHKARTDCWLVIEDRVVNITSWLDDHPGGEDILLQYAGSDASTVFDEVAHSGRARQILNKFVIGTIKSTAANTNTNTNTTASTTGTAATNFGSAVVSGAAAAMNAVTNALNALATPPPAQSGAGGGGGAVSVSVTAPPSTGSAKPSS